MADLDMDAASPRAPPLFHEVVFHIVTSEKLPQTTADEIKTVLVQGGAVEAPRRQPSTLSRITIDFEEVTHIIAADIDFAGYPEAEGLMVPVVTHGWVRASAAKNRLAPLRPFTPDPRFFFSNVVATAAELPVGDKEAICGGIVAMGGQFMNQLTKFTTHIVALNMDNEKCKQALEKKLKVKVVLPHWFDDCLKLGRRIDEHPYLLPNPEVERLDSSAPLSMPTGVDLSYTHAHVGGLMTQGPPQPPRNNFEIFKGKKVVLGEDLVLSERLRMVLFNIIGQANGTVTDSAAEADVYIGHFRDGSDYVEASRKGCFVGNLTWLYWMIAHGRWTNPLNRLLHYPVVRGGLPGMKNMKITVSNYGGDARLYLENLTEALGAKFTKSMKVDNTHLITAREHSEKCTAAKEWNIHMVNHLWLEDTYAQWAVQTITDPKYSHFPRRTNLTEVVGKTPIDQETVRRFWDEDLNAPDDLPTVPGKMSTLGTVANGVSKSTLTSTPAPSKRRRVEMDDSPVPPPSTGRRAKELATARLHDEIMPDIALYQKEMKRKGGVMGGRRRAGSADSVGVLSRASSKRSKSPSTEVGDEGEGKVLKKSKKRPPKPAIFLLITAWKGWLDHPQKEDSEKRILAELGIKCVQEPGQCNYLAAPHLVRTEKFCCALARAPVVVSTDWVEECISQERLVEPDTYLLVDPNGEKRLNVNLEESLARAKVNRGRLLEGQAIYCTAGVHGGYDVCRRIVEANGGVCIQFRTPKRPANAPDSEKMVLLSGDSSTDRKLWFKFQSMAEGLHREWHIYRADWILDAAMHQLVDWDDKYKAEP